VGGAVQVTNDATGDPAWVLQLQSGKFTAYDAICPHQGCTVEFVSAQTGFQCPCHGSQFDPQGKRINGPAPRGLTEISVTVAGGNVRAT
jgi:thiosulfate dehydrogenase [quinone] large subunit